MASNRYLKNQQEWEARRLFNLNLTSEYRAILKNIRSLSLNEITGRCRENKVKNLPQGNHSVRQKQNAARHRECCADEAKEPCSSEGTKAVH